MEAATQRRFIMEQNCSSTSEKLKLGRLVTDALGEIEGARGRVFCGFGGAIFRGLRRQG